MMHLSGSPTLARVGSRLCTRQQQYKHCSHEPLSSQQHMTVQLFCPELFHALCCDGSNLCIVDLCNPTARAAQVCKAASTRRARHYAAQPLAHLVQHVHVGALVVVDEVAVGHERQRLAVAAPHLRRRHHLRTRGSASAAHYAGIHLRAVHPPGCHSHASIDAILHDERLPARHTRLLPHCNASCSSVKRFAPCR